MTNLKAKTKAELIELVERLMFQVEDSKGNTVAGTEDILIDFINHLKNYFAGHQAGMLSKHEISVGINKIYDAFIFAKGIRKG